MKHRGENTPRAGQTNRTEASCNRDKMKVVAKKGWRNTQEHTYSEPCIPDAPMVHLLSNSSNMSFNSN